MMHATRNTLDAGIDRIRQSPKDRAQVEGLCLRPSFGARDFVEEIHLTPDHGIAGDRWERIPWLRMPDGTADPAIQVSILHKTVLDLVWVDRTAQPHPGDTFVADMDLGTENLPAGTRLHIGTSVLEVSDVFNSGCIKWRLRYGDAAKEWVTDPRYDDLRLRGVLCRVAKAGVIRNGDVIAKL